jgi:hypothetical protein
MRQCSLWVTAPAGAMVSAAAMAGGPVTQLNQFSTGYNSSGVPLVVPSIDPAGVAFHAPSGHLFIADSEIEEVSAVWSLIQKNIFECSRTGNTLYSSHNIALMGIGEPTGITYNPGDGYFYVSDDDDQRITRLSFSPGSGFLIDDYVDTDNTADAGDPEGVTCDPATARLYVVDGHDALIVIYHYQDSTGFVLIDVLDLALLNSSSNVPDDPEGIVFDPCSGHLLLVSDPDEAIWEFTTDGLYVARYDIDTLSPDVIAPQGLTIGPTSSSNDNPAAMAVYIADGGIDNNNNAAERDGRIYEIAAFCNGGNPPPPITDCNGNGVADAQDIASGTSADCNGNGIPDECDGGCLPGGGTLLVSFISTTTLPGLGSVANEDIVARSSSGAWSMYFDGSDVGAGSFTIDALAVLPGGDLLLSFTSDGIIAGLLADDSDLLRFHPTSLGPNTAGTWSIYFDGSDVDLTSSSEDVDGVDIAPDGRIVISTTDSPSVTGLSSLKDEDLLAFTATSLGDVTAGTWSMYFDGSDVGLSESSDEDVDGVVIRPDGKILLSTTGFFVVTGVTGADEDVFAFTPITLGPVTAGAYQSFFTGIPAGVPTGADIGAVEQLP